MLLSWQSLLFIIRIYLHVVHAIQPMLNHRTNQNAGLLTAR